MWWLLIQDFYLLSLVYKCLVKLLVSLHTFVPWCNSYM